MALLFNYSPVCKGKRYLTPQLSDVGQEPCLFPMEITWCSTAAVCGKFITEVTFYEEEEQACFTSPKILVLWYQCWGFWEGQNKHTELKARLVATTFSHLLVNCHCFKRKWSSGISICIECVQKKFCFLLPFMLWTALHLSYFFQV